MGVGCPVKRSARTAETRRLADLNSLLTLFLLALIRPAGLVGGRPVVGSGQIQ